MMKAQSAQLLRDFLAFCKPEYSLTAAEEVDDGAMVTRELEDCEVETLIRGFLASRASAPPRE